MLAPRRAHDSERDQVRALIEATYHDADAYNNLYFSSAYRDRDAFVLPEDDGRVLAVGMLVSGQIAWSGCTYPVGIHYAAAVREGYHGRGLIKEIVHTSDQTLPDTGATHAIMSINLKANKPWQSIGYSPAFPMRFRQIGIEEMQITDVSVAHAEDASIIQFLDAAYEHTFSAYAHWRRSHEEWAFLLREYALDGNTLLYAPGGAIMGYCVYTLENTDLIIKECAAPPEGEMMLKQAALRLTGARCAECWLPGIPGDIDNVFTGAIKRVAPGGLPDFPPELGYFNLYHM